jgi:uncharacterized protein
VRLFSHPERFFEAFSGLAERATRCAELLKELLATPGNAADVQAQLSVLEQEALALRQQVMVQSAAVTVTPLPREDLHDVAALLSDLVAMLHDGAGRTQSLQLDTPREPAARLADVVVRAVRCIQLSVDSVRERDFIAKRCADMETLAHEGQAIYDHAVEALFTGSPDPVEVIRWKEVYDLLEHAVEQCQAVEAAISSIVLENRG